MTAILFGLVGVTVAVTLGLSDHGSGSVIASAVTAIGLVGWALGYSEGRDS